MTVEEAVRELHRRMIDLGNPSDIGKLVRHIPTSTLRLIQTAAQEMGFSGLAQAIHRYLN